MKHLHLPAEHKRQRRERQIVKHGMVQLKHLGPRRDRKSGLVEVMRHRAEIIGLVAIKRKIQLVPSKRERSDYAHHINAQQLMLTDRSDKGEKLVPHPPYGSMKK